MHAIPRDEVGRPELFDTATLVAYLTRQHHDQWRATLPALQLLAGEAARTPGRHAAVLRTVAVVVDELIDAILPHLDEEEQHIFPVLAGVLPVPVTFGRTLAAMREEGHAVMHLVRRMQFATGGFRIPADAGRAHRELVAALRELAIELEAHVAVEIDVLLVRWGKTRS